jgi:two-component system response regulator HydG
MLSNKDHSRTGEGGRMARILLVDDDASFATATKTLLEADRHSISTAASVKEASKKLSENEYDLLLVDLALPDGSGLELVRDQGPNTVVITGHPSIESAVRAIRGPVVDYLIKPLDRETLGRSVDRATKSQPSGRKSGTDTTDKLAIVGDSPGMRRLKDQIAEFGPIDVTVLVTGESGTGKELVAEALAAEYEARGEFVPVNCGAIPQELIASELFGHEKGAFTGATTLRHGVFERAKSGTVLLDEIAELPLEQQVALLRVLETRKVQRVGGGREIPVNSRVIAATNKDLKKLVADGEFREDLYFRLAVVPIHIPPLRERRGDIPLLAEHFLKRYHEQYGSPIAISDEALTRLEAFSWPGNVRELKHVLLRSALLNRDENTIEKLPEGFEQLSNWQNDEAQLQPGVSISDVEKALIFKTLKHFGGKRKETAEALGISSKTLYNRLREYGTETDEE